MATLRAWSLEDCMPSQDGTAQNSSSTALISPGALRLSDVAPALQALLQTPSNVALPRTSSRPVVKLPRSEDHKNELLKKILHGSSSSGGTQSSKPPGGRRSQSRSSTSKSVNMGSDRQSKSSELHKKPIDDEVATMTRREKHMYLEKLRRKDMTHLYATLRSLVPEAKPKTDRCTFLTEAMDYIQSLQRELEDLAALKSEIMSSTRDNLNLGSATPTRMPVKISDDVKDQLLTTADVAVRFCSGEAFITLNSPKKKGIWSGILQVLKDQNLEPLNVALSTSRDTYHYHWIHAKVPVASALRSQDLQKMIQNLLLSHASLACQKSN